MFPFFPAGIPSNPLSYPHLRHFEATLGSGLSPRFHDRYPPLSPCGREKPTATIVFGSSRLLLIPLRIRIRAYVRATTRGGIGIKYFRFEFPSPDMTPLGSRG